MNISRRLSRLVFTVFLIFAGLPCMADTQQIQPLASKKPFEELESSSGGRLGLSTINTANNTRIEYRGEERFPFCSTGKVMVVSTILKQSENDPNLLRKQITYDQNQVDESGYAPITKQHLGSGMRVGELCQAAMEYSDNTAMNLLLKLLGGPAAVTAFARTIPDESFRLDRWEPELNTAIPGDVRDTTTPNAMADSLKQLALGDFLALPQREQLQTWLKNNTTGDAKIRAGVPKGWVVGDKTGSGSYGTTNDIAVIWPPNCHPIVMVVYLTQKEKNAIKHDAVIASATRLVIEELARTDQCLKRDMSDNSVN